MASFGTGLVRESVFVTELEKEFQARLGLSCSQSSLSPLVTTPVGQWLNTLGLSDYESLFMNSGFDDIDFINGVLGDSDLKEMGITSESDRATILEASKSLPLKIQERHNLYNNNVNEPDETVQQWLQRLHLDNYIETFSKHLYNDMERIKRIWEVELTAVLEIQKPGHRKRILMSVSTNDSNQGPNLDDITADLNVLKNNIQQLKEEIRDPSASVHTTQPNVTVAVVTTSSTATTTTTTTGTLRHHKKSRPAPQPPTTPAKTTDLEIRAPSELLVGVPATLKTQWRHQPLALVTGYVNYIANYLGSTVVKELRGTESTKKSIQKLKKSTTKDQRSTPDIILSISYRGVKFLNTLTQELVCEHEIRNIHCACQDADDLTHFAYITKDHASSSHYCHVFCVQTMDQATEVILTLGQAFEVAYQMVLKEQMSGRGHIRSQSANQLAVSPGKVTTTITTNGSSQQNHARSHSVNEIKLNGHQFVLAPISLSTEDFNGRATNNNANTDLPRTPTSSKTPISVREQV